MRWVGGVWGSAEFSRQEGSNMCFALVESHADRLGKTGIRSYLSIGKCEISLPMDGHCYLSTQVIALGLMASGCLESFPVDGLRAHTTYKLSNLPTWVNKGLSKCNALGARRG